MRTTDISGYLVRALIVLLVAGIAVAPVWVKSRTPAPLHRTKGARR